VIKSSQKRNKKKESEDSVFDDEALPRVKRKQNKGFSVTTTHFKTDKEGKKSKNVKGKDKFAVKKEYAEINTKHGSE